VLALEPTLIVPGHGPVAGPAGVREARSYLSRLLEHTLGCIERGVEPEEAYRGFDAGEYRLWAHASRAFLTILSVYAEHRPDLPLPSWAQAMEVVLGDDAS
jgi:hypothetical protein